MEELNDIEKQLHEQYAINANNNLTTMVSIATFLLGVIGMYGYVLVYTDLSFIQLSLLSNENNVQFTTDTLLLAASASMFILVILFYISVKLGATQRLEQFIAYSIRRKYYKEEYNKQYRVFPGGYEPFEKSRWNFLAGLHNTCIRVFCIMYLLIVCTSAPFVVRAHVVIFVLFFVMIGGTIIVGAVYLNNKFITYKNRCEEYKEYKENKDIINTKYTNFE